MRKLYEYLFFKFFKFTRLIDRTQKPELRQTWLGPIWIFSILETLFILFAVLTFLSFFSIELSAVFPFLVGGIILFANCIYFLRNGRWKKIIEYYENKEDEILAIKMGFAIFVGIVIYLILVFTIGDIGRENIKKQKNEKEKAIKELQNDTIKNNKKMTIEN